MRLSMRLICGVGALALVAWVALCISSARAAQPAGPRTPNPHWTKDGCKTCHEMQGAKAMPIAPDRVDDICLQCHDGVKAAREFHPVHRQFKETDLITRPKGWPVVNGELACATCHEMTYACNLGNSPAANPNFLRNYRQGRARSQPFCQNCHKESAYRKINPHEMLLNPTSPVSAHLRTGTAPTPGAQPSATRPSYVAPGRPEIIEDKCLFCHTKPLDRNEMKRTGNTFLKADERKLCRDCHPTHKDPMMNGHIGLKLTPEILALMYVRERMGLAAAPSSEVLEQVQSKGLKPTLMAPGPNDTITCSTCHNPHQHGVFPTGSELDYRSMRMNRDKKLISPVHENVWCRHCHEM